MSLINLKLQEIANAVDINKVRTHARTHARTHTHTHTHTHITHTHTHIACFNTFFSSFSNLWIPTSRNGVIGTLVLWYNHCGDTRVIRTTHLYLYSSACVRMYHDLGCTAPVPQQAQDQEQDQEQQPQEGPQRSPATERVDVMSLRRRLEYTRPASVSLPVPWPTGSRPASASSRTGTPTLEPTASSSTPPSAPPALPSRPRQLQSTGAKTGAKKQIHTSESPWSQVA